MTLRDHLGVVWRRRWVVVLLSVLVAAAVYVVVDGRDDVYQAEAVLAVDLQASAGPLGEEDALFLGRTFAGLATTDAVLDDTAEAVALERDDVRDRVEVDSDQGYVQLVATGSSSRAAEDLADAFSRALVDAVRAQQRVAAEERLDPLEDELDEVVEQLVGLPEDSTLRGPLEVRYDRLLDAITGAQLEAGRGARVVSEARAGEAPVAPRPRSAAALALLVALVVNAELAVALAALRGRFSSADPGGQVAAVTGLPVLASVPRGGGSAAEEAVRLLRTDLLLMRPRPRSIAVLAVDQRSSAAAARLAAGLARATSASGTPAIVVDADLSSPAVHEQVGEPSAPGLTDVLSGAHWSTALRMLDDGLGLLPAGSPVEDPGGLLLSGPYAAVLEELASEAVVVVHTAPGDVPAEGLAAAAACSATVVLLDGATTGQAEAREVVEALRRVGARPVGVVLDRAEAAPRRRGRRPPARPARSGARPALPRPASRTLGPAGSS